MPADTLSEMILGYAVILGVLVMYLLTLVYRTHRANYRHNQENEEKTSK